MHVPIHSMTQLILIISFSAIFTFEVGMKVSDQSHAMKMKNISRRELFSGKEPVYLHLDILASNQNIWYLF